MCDVLRQEPQSLNGLGGDRPPAHRVSTPLLTGSCTCVLIIINYKWLSAKEIFPSMITEITHIHCHCLTLQFDDHRRLSKNNNQYYYLLS